MPLSASFSVFQTVGAESIVSITDTSTGSDTDIVSRVVYLAKANGGFLIDSGASSSVIVIAEVKAVCLINSMTLRTNGDLIEVYAIDPVLGAIVVGSHTQTAGDTTLAILITNLINATNANAAGYTAINVTATEFNIIAKTGLGDTINGLGGGVQYPGGSTSSTFSGGVTATVLPASDYNYWPYADSSISLDVLDKDYALNITVQWLGVTNNILYSSSQLVGLTSYNENFDYTLTTVLNSNPLLINDNSFRINKTDLRLFIDSGDNAILRASDIEGAQLCYDEATKIRLGSVYYFNESTS